MKREDAEEYTQALGQVVAGGWRQVALGKRLGVPQALSISTEEWVEGRLGGYVRLSIPERREAVAELTEEGMSTREIGDVLGVDNKTVHNDQKAVENSTAPEAEPSVEAESGPAPVENSTEPELEAPVPLVVAEDVLAEERADPARRRTRALKLLAEGVSATSTLARDVRQGLSLDDVAEAAAHDNPERHAADARRTAEVWSRLYERLTNPAAELRRVK